MSRVIELSELLLRWEEAKELGKPATPESLCQDQPELLPELRRCIAVLERMNLRLNHFGAPMKSEIAIAASAKDTPAGPSLPSIDVLPPIPGYEFLSVLGRGGMGLVVKARRTADDQSVAIKVIARHHLPNDSTVRRFRREAKLAATLDHPNIVRTLCAGHVDGRHYLVMEYVPGVTLLELVHRSGPLPVQLACHFLKQAIDALDHASLSGLVHRDIKPSNLMVNQETQTLKVLDFGLACVTQRKRRHDESHLTDSGMLLGTLDFIAPEQALNPRAVDVRSDMYSLGCTFYFLLTGKVPFPCAQIMQKIDKHRWEQPIPIEHFRSDVAPPIVAICNQMMAKSPDHRFQTPRCAADALVPLLG